MIASILTFSLKSAICSAVFVGYYLLALRKAQMNGFNRIYLLSAALLSILLPFTTFRLLNIAPAIMQDFPLLSVTGIGTEEAIAPITATARSFNWQVAISGAYFAVAIALGMRIVARFAWVYSLKKKGEKTTIDGLQLIKTDTPRAPFSFMNMLFWPKHMRHDSPEGNDILMHELAHIRQRHTLDKIIMELILAICWLNPFNWLIKKELWLQHEFLADKYAIKDGDGKAFAKMLLYSVSHSARRSILNPFFQSPVKRRLEMLTQTVQCSHATLRRFMSIPILLGALVLTSADIENTTAAKGEKKIVLVLDAAHGGEDAGGKSIYGQQEKDITLALCKKMVLLSKEYNIEIVTTRFEDVSYTLDERVNTSNNTQDAIFLSLHVNKSTNAGVRSNDYELGINPNGKEYDKSRLLASSIANRLKAQKLAVKVADHSKVYVIRNNQHPALLMECGNLDDADNIALLSDEKQKEKLCRNILSGIVDYNTQQSSK
jgi:N-acetylmuramoyl-L-alanine amidase